MQIEHSLFRAAAVCSLLSLAFGTLSCDDDPTHEGGGNPTVGLREVAATAESVRFLITPTDADRCAFVVLTQEPTHAPSAAEIFAASDRTDCAADKTTEHTLAPEPETVYRIFAAAARGSRFGKVARLDITVPDGTLHMTELAPNGLHYTANGEDGSDEYYFGFCTGEITQDEDGNYLPLDPEGYLFYVDLYGTSSADPDFPIVPDGEYTLGEGRTRGTLNHLFSFVVTRSMTGEIIQTPLSAGEVETTYDARTETYEVRCTYTLKTGEVLRARYEGEILMSEGFTQPPLPTLPSDVDTQFVGYWARYDEAAAIVPGLDIIKMQLYDKPLVEGRQTDGYLLSLELYVPDIEDTSHIVLPTGDYEVSLATNPYTTPVGDVLNLGDMGVAQMGTTVRRIDAATGEASYGAILKGGLKVSADDRGVYTIVVDMTTGENIRFQGTYTGKIEVEGSISQPTEPFSPLEKDTQVNLEGVKVTCSWYGDIYDTGTGSFRLRTEDPATMEGFIFDLNLPLPEGLAALEGTYRPGKDYAAGTFDIGAPVVSEGGTMYNGSYGFIQYADEWGLGFAFDKIAWAPAVDGSFSITKSGENYHIVYDVLDDRGNHVTGDWTGPIALPANTAAGR